MVKRKLISMFIAHLPGGEPHEYTTFAVYEGGVLYYYAPFTNTWMPTHNLLPPAEVEA